MSNRQRRIVLGIVLGVWAVVVLSYAVRGRWPDPAWAGVPPAVIVALAPARQDPPPADREREQ